MRTRISISLCALIVLGVANFGIAAESFLLVTNGCSSAQIVVADDPVNAVQYGAQELQAHIRALTGAKLPIVCWSARDPAAYPICLGMSPGTFEYDVSALGRQEYVVDVSPMRTILLGLDDSSKEKVRVAYTNGVVVAAVQGRQPRRWGEHGSLNAVYDFLYALGVRWLDATDVGTVLPPSRKLRITCGVRKVQPFVFCRDTDAEAQPWFETSRYPALAAELGTYRTNAFAYAYSRRGGCKALLDRQNDAWLLRVRAGGEQGEANHSFYGWYDRYWNEQSRHFRERRPDYFAKGYGAAKPPQLCYTNPEVLRLVIAEVREYLDHGGFPIRNQQGEIVGYDPHWGENSYSLEPMDNSEMCKCEVCRALAEPQRERDDCYSTYWFTFVNKVAKEIKKSHPQAKLRTLAYMTHKGLPTNVRLEDNVVVYFCLDSNRTGAVWGDGPVAETPDFKRMAAWRKMYPDQPLAFWLYNCFPNETADGSGFHCVPGFFAHKAVEEFQFFKSINACEAVYQCGINGDLDAWLQLELMVDPQPSADGYLTRYFSQFGKAGPALRKFYETVEARYCSSCRPKGIGVSLRGDWGYVCPPKVMDELAKIVETAKTAAADEEDVVRKRVELYLISNWEYMLPGSKQFVERTSTPTPCWTARRVAAAGGNVDRVDWKSVPETKTPLYLKSSAQVSKTTAAVRFVHDGEWLYFEFKLGNFDAKKLYSKPLINPYDCWEIIVSRQLSRPYRYYVCGPDGRSKASSFGEVNFRNAVPAEESGSPIYGAVYKATVDADSWTARWAMPLVKMLDAPVNPGDTIYFSPVACLNRNVCGTGSTGNFDITSLVSFSTVHTVDRMAAVTLEK